MKQELLPMLRHHVAHMAWPVLFSAELHSAQQGMSQGTRLGCAVALGCLYCGRMPNPILHSYAKP